MTGSRTIEWITAGDVAEYLGTLTPRQPDLDQMVAAVRAEIERRRSDVDFTLVSESGVYANLWFGALLWVVDLYNVRTAPTGYPAYGDPGADIYGPLDQSRWINISRLCGLKIPVVA